MLFAVIFLAVIGIVGYCAWRFLAKKRTKTNQKQQDIDEQAILDGMEEDLDINEEEIKVVLGNLIKDKTNNDSNVGSSKGVFGQTSV